MIPENTQHLGLFPRMRRFLFGNRAARLTERASRTHWLSYLLIISQSIAVVLVFGHAEVGLLLAPSVALRAMAFMVLFLLVITVIAADLAMLETLTRIPPLTRNRQSGMLWEHLWYVFFAFVVEGSTYAVVLAAIDSDPQILIQSRSLIPTTGPIFVALVVTRVVLICWSAVQLMIVRGKLPVLLSTLTNTGKELVGAQTEMLLAQLDINGVTLPDMFRTYAAMARPPRRIPTLFNGWLVKRELAAEAEEERQATNVINALEELDRRRVRTGTPNEPPTPPRGGGRAPAPAAPVASLNPRAAQDVRTAAESVAEAMPAASSLYVVKNAPKGRRRNQPGRRTKSGKRDTSSVEEIAKAVWIPGMSVSELQAATVSKERPTGISRAAASKHRRTGIAEKWPVGPAVHSSAESA